MLARKASRPDLQAGAAKPYFGQGGGYNQPKKTIVVQQETHGDMLDKPNVVNHEDHRYSPELQARQSFNTNCARHRTGCTPEC
jgi:hypothetical protein